MNASLKTRMAEFLDAEQVEELRNIPGEGDLDLFADVAQLFLRTSPELLQNLEKAVQERDPATMVRFSHMLKGSSSNLGAFRLSAKSSQMEQSVLQGNLDQSALFAEISSDYQELKSILNEVLSSPAE